MCDFIRVAESLALQELLHGRAISFHPKQDGALRVISGRLYVTTDQSPEDYFLEAGATLQSTLHVAADTHVVAETWNHSRQGVAVFEWVAAISPHPPVL